VVGRNKSGHHEPLINYAYSVLKKSRGELPMRTGADYLRSLKDGRRVFVDGEPVKDVTTHPAFRGAARSIANLYDIAAAADLRERMTFVSPKTAAPVLDATILRRGRAAIRRQSRRIL
jgi:aromatic ring hydroxylase